MQRAFVMRLTADCDPEKELRGRIEHVRSGQVLHFENLDQLVLFLTRCVSRERQTDEKEQEAGIA